MAQKDKLFYVCPECGARSRRPFSVCSTCGKYVEAEIEKETSIGQNRTKAKPTLLKDVNIINDYRYSTGISEFDRVMGGGIIEDGVTVLTSAPGVGKTTLLLEVANKLATIGKKVLYCSGEENKSQLKSRIVRIIKDPSDNLLLLDNKSMDEIMAAANEIETDVLFIDSINVVTTEDYKESRANTPTQIIECANKVVDFCKMSKKPCAAFIIAQMTKDDELSGPRTFEHLVDTVLILDGDDRDDMRFLRSTKNRFGQLDTGMFIMDSEGMKEVLNPAEHFVTKRKHEVSGVALSVSREGTREIMIEVESLASPSPMPYPTRITTCLKKEHLNVLLSVLEIKAKQPTNNFNIVVNTTGNLKIVSRNSDLAVMMSVVSAMHQKSIPNNVAFVAEVGLTGDLKKVPSLERILATLDRLGYKKVYIAGDNETIVRENGLEVIACRTVKDVIKNIF